MKRTVPQQQQHQASSVCGAAAAAGRSRSTPNSSTPTTTSTLLDRRRTVMEFTLFLVLLCMTSTTTHCWQVDLRPNTQVDLKGKGQLSFPSSFSSSSTTGIDSRQSTLTSTRHCRSPSSSSAEIWCRYQLTSLLEVAHIPSVVLFKYLSSNCI